MKNLEDKLKEIVPTVLTNEPMSKHTTFTVGGPCDFYLIPQNENELVSLLEFLSNNDINYYLIGNGSNILVKDNGFRGVIIDLSKMNIIEKIGDNKIRAQAGASLKDIANKALEENLTGYEFASGIPGTLGGAVWMNAGAYDGEHKDVVSSVRYIDKEGNIEVATGDECDFGYRNSLFKKNDYIILSAVIDLNEGEHEKIETKMKELNKRRRDKQPLNLPSAGSTFKRPEGHFAGKLIQDSGLQGISVGGAQVSKKHAGFIVNKGGASAQDILNLIELVQNRVKEKFDVELEPEVIVIGE